MMFRSWKQRALVPRHRQIYFAQSVEREQVDDQVLQHEDKHVLQHESKSDDSDREKEDNDQLDEVELSTTPRTYDELMRCIIKLSKQIIYVFNVLDHAK